MLGGMIEVDSARAAFCIGPIAATTQSRRRRQHPVARLQHDIRHRLHRVEPAPVHADIHVAPLEPVDAEPVDKVRVHRAYSPCQHRGPRADGIDTPAKTRHRPLDPRACAAVEPVGRVRYHRLQPSAKHRQGPRQCLKCDRRIGNRIDHSGVRVGEFGFEAIASLRRIALVTREHHRPDRRQQPLDRTRWHIFGQPLQPAIAGERLRRNPRHLDGKPALFVIGRDIGEPGRQPAPPSARLAFGADDPTAQLDGFLARQRSGKHRIRRVEQMMAFIKNDPRRAAHLVASARGIDHHQSMVGDDDIGMDARACGAFDEAFFVMRAPGIDALAAPVGQRGRTVATEQRWQPTRQISADHVAVFGIRGPARDQMRQRRRAACKPALQCVLQVQQTQIILAALAHHDFRFEGFIIGIDPLGLAHQLALQRLGKGRNPYRPIGIARPERSWCKIAQGLANAGARLGQHHIGFTLARTRGKNPRRRLRKIALALPRFCIAPDQRSELCLHAFRVQRDHTRRCAQRRFLPFGQFGE